MLVPRGKKIGPLLGGSGVLLGIFWSCGQFFFTKNKISNPVFFAVEMLKQVTATRRKNDGSDWIKPKKPAVIERCDGTQLPAWGGMNRPARPC